jgi:Lrp/AsnC family transcriptional regulator, regulator for asnA, asnC and gidA
MSNQRSSTIDEIDKAILGCLIENSRKNFNKIAMETGLSKNSVWNRYKKMVDNGVITGSTVQINYKRLGYNAVGTLLMDVDPAKVEMVSSYIKNKIPDVFGPFRSPSRYNLRAVVTLKTISEIENLKQDLRKKLPISEISSTLWTDVWFTPDNLSLIHIMPVELSSKSLSGSFLYCDEIDLGIISELARNSRISFRTISKDLRISVDTVARRYRKLRENDIIVPRIQINATKVGYFALANFYLKINQNINIDAVIREMMPIEDIFYIMKCDGDYNVGAVLLVKSAEDIINTGNQITGIDGAKRIETIVSEISDIWPLSRTYTSTLGRSLPNPNPSNE